MPSSAVHIFDDPYDYAAAVRGSVVEVTVTGRGDFTGKIIRIDLHRLWMLRSSDNLPRTAHIVHPNGRAVISFRADSNGPSQLQSGIEVQPTKIVRRFYKPKTAN